MSWGDKWRVSFQNAVQPLGGKNKQKKKPSILKSISFIQKSYYFSHNNPLMKLYLFHGDDIIPTCCTFHFGTKLFKYIFLFLHFLHSFLAVHFKSHALLETVVSAFILNHMTRDNKKKSIQYSGSMLHSFNFGITQLPFCKLCVYVMENHIKAVKRIHAMYLGSFTSLKNFSIGRRCMSSRVHQEQLK